MQCCAPNNPEVDDRQLAEAYYPAWLKALSYAGIPALTGIALWLVSRPLWEDGVIGLSRRLELRERWCSVKHQ